MIFSRYLEFLSKYLTRIGVFEHFNSSFSNDFDAIEFSYSVIMVHVKRMLNNKSLVEKCKVLKDLEDEMTNKDVAVNMVFLEIKCQLGLRTKRSGWRHWKKGVNSAQVLGMENLKTQTERSANDLSAREARKYHYLIK